MPMERQTAKRVRIVDLVSGEWVKKEGMEPSYVVTPSGDAVSRARITGTIVGKFTSEDGNFSSVTIDDSTATMRAKLWREIELLNGAGVGDLVNLIGKVREYEGEIYIVPEVIRKITPDEESLMRLEILAKMKKVPVPAEKMVRKPKPEPSNEEGDLRKKVLSLIESSPDGVKYSDLMQQAGGAEDALEGIINELLGEGVCYEPVPGKIKKI